MDKQIMLSKIDNVTKEVIDDINNFVYEVKMSKRGFLSLIFTYLKYGDVYSNITFNKLIPSTIRMLPTISNFIKIMIEKDTYKLNYIIGKNINNMASICDFIKVHIKPTSAANKINIALYKYISTVDEIMIDLGYHVHEQKGE